VKVGFTAQTPALRLSRGFGVVMPRGEKVHRDDPSRVELLRVLKFRSVKEGRREETRLHRALRHKRVPLTREWYFIEDVREKLGL